MSLAALSEYYFDAFQRRRFLYFSRFFVIFFVKCKCNISLTQSKMACHNYSCISILSGLVEGWVRVHMDWIFSLTSRYTAIIGLWFILSVFCSVLTFHVLLLLSLRLDFCLYFNFRCWIIVLNNLWVCVRHAFMFSQVYFIFWFFNYLQWSLIQIQFCHSYGKVKGCYLHLIVDWSFAASRIGIPTPCYVSDVCVLRIA